MPDPSTDEEPRLSLRHSPLRVLQPRSSAVSTGRLLCYPVRVLSHSPGVINVMHPPGRRCPICGNAIPERSGCGRKAEYDRTVCRDLAATLKSLSDQVDRVAAGGITHPKRSALRRELWTVANQLNRWGNGENDPS